MNLKKLSLATGGSFLFLLVVNALLFPFVFPNGIPEHYQNARSSPLNQYHLLALFITALLMAYLYPIGYKGGAAWKEGLLLAVFVSLPNLFHVYAMVNTSITGQLLPVVWTAVTWGLAGVVIGWIHGGKEIR